MKNPKPFKEFEDRIEELTRRYDAEVAEFKALSENSVFSDKLMTFPTSWLFLNFFPN